jgi:hypothetical protein
LNGKQQRARETMNLVFLELESAALVHEMKINASSFFCQNQDYYPTLDGQAGQVNLDFSH